MSHTLTNCKTMDPAVNISSGSGLSPSDGCVERYDSGSLKLAAAIRASVGFFSFVCCLGVILLIIVFKKYRFFTQRLILNLTITAAIHSITYTFARVNYYTPRPIRDDYCYFGGFLNHYTAAVELVSIWCITIDLIVKALSSKNTKKLEVVYYLLTYFLPAFWFWLPLWRQAYGTSGPWCGIRTLNPDCSPFDFGRYVQFGIWYIPLYISLTLIFLAILVVLIKVARDSQRWVGKFDPTAETKSNILKSEIRQLLWYPIIYLLINIFSFVSQIYNIANPQSASTTSLALSYLRLLTSPLRGAVIALAYALDKETRSRITKAHCRAAYHEWCSRDQHSVKEYDTHYTQYEDDNFTLTSNAQGD